MPFMTGRGSRIFYQVDSYADPWTNPPWVFMQSGFGRSGEIWRKWVPELASSYRVVRMDLRGCGGSDDPGGDFVYDVDALVDDLALAFSEIGIPSAHYVGESLGGILGIKLAVRSPELLRSLTVVSTPSRLDGHLAEKEAVGYGSWAEAMETLGLDGWWRATRAGVQGIDVDEARDAHYAKEFARTPVHVAIALSRAVAGTDISDLVGKLSVPLLDLMSLRSPFGGVADLATAVLEQGKGRVVSFDAPHDMTYLLAPELSRLAKDFMVQVDRAGNG